ncbi:carbohydrate-binding module family 13 protein [Gyrodon lividus]|nr:carbohydrate-binding module family 13 protein [Gyrodon lividus]
MANIQSHRIYSITNVKTKSSCIDLSEADNYTVTGREYRTSPNQEWIFVKVGNDFYIRSLGTGLYLAIAGEPRGGQKVVGSPSPFAWRVEDQADGPGAVRSVLVAYVDIGFSWLMLPRLVVPDTNFNADLSDYGNPKPGTPVELWKKSKGDHKLWKLKKL